MSVVMAQRPQRRAPVLAGPVMAPNALPRPRRQLMAWRPGMVSISAPALAIVISLWAIALCAALIAVQQHRRSVTRDEALPAPALTAHPLRAPSARRAGRPVRRHDPVVGVLHRSASMGSAYIVQWGDTLWSIAARYGTDVMSLRSLNHLSAGATIVTGRRLALPRGARARPAVLAAPATPDGLVERALTDGALAARLDPALVKAVAWQESSWRMVVAADGGIGVMQLMPDTVAWVGRALLGRRLDPYNLADNIAGGTALLRYDLERFGDRWTAVAAYHQGTTGVATAGVSPEAAAYADRVLGLTARFRGEAPWAGSPARG